jgi:hypothetical protein
MVVPLDREHLLAAVERSPQAATAHDRAGWVGLFTADGWVQDPVGSRPHIGRDQLRRFYDTFIGPRDIVFRRNVDIVAVATVIRDLELEVSLSGSRRMTIPAVLRYDLNLSQELPRIAALRAYWELPTMMMQFLRLGLAAAPAGATLAGGLLRHQKLTGAWGFAKTSRGAGGQGKAVATRFTGHLASGETRAGEDLLRGPITINDEATNADELAGRLRAATITKVIASGHTVVVSTTSARGPAVLFTAITPRQGLIESVGCYLPTGAA